MTAWTSDELSKIETAEELEISSVRDDGKMRKPRTIWVVRVGDDIYVRSVNGRGSDWFSGIQTRYEGHILVGVIDKDVRFEEVGVNDKINEQIDAAYRSKYHRYAASIIDSINSQKARAATLKLIPRSTAS